MTASADARPLRGEDLASAWDALADRCLADPFVRPGWIAAWHASFGRGAPETLTASRDGRLTGVLPVLRLRGLWRSPTNAHTPAFSPLAEDDAALRVLVATMLAREPAVVSIAFLDRSDSAVDVLRAAAESAGYAVTLRAIHTSPVLRLEDVDAWRSAPSRRALADLRRRRRRLEEHGRTTFTRIGDSTALECVMDLEQRGWKAARGTAILGDATLRAFYRRVARWAAGRGALRVAVLRLDERPIAAVFGLEEAAVLHLLKAGYDPAFARYSPGQLLLEDILQTAFGAGVRAVEFHGADEPYKRVWTADVRRRVAVEAFAPSTAGRAARAAAHHGRPMVRRARELASSHGRRPTS